MGASKSVASPVPTLFPTVPANRSRLGFSASTSDGVGEASRYLSKLAADGVTTVNVHEARGDVFLDLSIEGVRFQAVADTNPYVTRKDGSG